MKVYHHSHCLHCLNSFGAKKTFVPVHMIWLYSFKGFSAKKLLLSVDFSSNFTNSSNEERISISQTSIVAVGAAEYPNLKFYQLPSQQIQFRELAFEFLEMK